MWRLRAPLLALLLMQVILLASSGVTATKKPLGKQETCNMKNHMIEYLRNNGVQIYERPQISSAYCNTEWDVYGTCCDPTLLSSYIQMKQTANNQTLKELTTELEKLDSMIEKFKSRAKPLPKQKLQMANGLTFSTADPIRESDRLARQTIDSEQSALESMRKTNIANQQKCVAKINSVISKSACSICSGRSDDFFNNDAQLKISEPACRAVLEDCLPAWSGMLETAQRVRNIGVNIRSLSTYSNNLGALEEEGITMNLDSFITNRNLIPIMKKCRTTSLTECSFSEVSQLCEQFIHIQAPAYGVSSFVQNEDILKQAKKDQDSTFAVLRNLNSVMASAEHVPKPEGDVHHNSTYVVNVLRAYQRMTFISDKLLQYWSVNRSRQPLLERLKEDQKEQKSKTLEKTLKASYVLSRTLIFELAKAVMIKCDFLRQLALSVPKINNSTIEELQGTVWDPMCTIWIEKEHPADAKLPDILKMAASGLQTSFYRKMDPMVQSCFDMNFRGMINKLVNLKAVEKTAKDQSRSLMVIPVDQPHPTSELSVFPNKMCNPCAEIIADWMESP